jgi:hypothetical protein
MTHLPDPSTLATLVSNVTQTMCGVSFIAATPPDNAAELACWRMAVLKVTGDSPWQVALFSDQQGCTALGAALFGCPADSLDSTMLEDSLCELLNMAAGQIKGVLAPDSALGLPKITSPGQLTPKFQAAMREGVLLRSQASVKLMILISEGLD